MRFIKKPDNRYYMYTIPRKISNFFHKQKTTEIHFSYFIIGTLIYPFSPLGCTFFYFLFLIIQIFTIDYKNIKNRNAVLGIAFFIFSLWMIFRTSSFWGFIKHSLNDPILFPVTVVDYLLFFLILFFFLEVKISSKYIYRIAWVFCLSSISIFILAVLEKYFGFIDNHYVFPSENFPLIDVFLYPGPSGRTHAGLKNSNILGLYCILLLSPSIGLLFHETFRLFSYKKNKTKGTESWHTMIHSFKLLFILLCISLLVIVISWSGSRATFIGLVLLTTAFIIISKSKILISSCICLISTFLLALIFKVEFFFSKLAEIIPGDNILSRLSNFQDWSTYHRLEIFRCATELIAEKPLLGWEIGTMAFECQERLGVFSNHAHNIFLQLGSEIGIPFTVLISLSILYIFIKAGKNLIVSHYFQAQDNQDIFLLSSFYLGAVSVSVMHLFSVALLHSYKLLFIYTFFLAVSYSNIPQRKRNTSE